MYNFASNVLRVVLKFLSNILTLSIFCCLLINAAKNNILLYFYDSNTAVFVELYCENKSRPELNCNGKCKLAKIDKEDKKEATNTLKQLQADVLYYNITTHDYWVPSIVFSENEVRFESEYILDYCYQYFSKSLKPPDYFS